MCVYRDIRRCCLCYQATMCNVAKLTVIQCVMSNIGMQMAISVAGEAPPPVVKSSPKPPVIPPGRRSMRQPPIPDEQSHRPLPPPPQAPQEPKTIHVSSDDYENMYYGMWDCETTTSHELSFHSGDMIHVVDREHDSAGWWTGVMDGKVGMVPKSFLTAAYAAA